MINSCIALVILILVHCIDAYQRAFVDRISYPTRPLGEPLELVHPEDKPMVNKYPEMFPKKLPGKPRCRDIGFIIELIPGVGPIVKRPYKMDVDELKELKKQLKEQLDKSFQST